MTTTIHQCIHGIALKSVKDSWEIEYAREKAGDRSSAVMCSCCLSPSYGSWTCPTCSLVEVEA